jgi:signal transduction histidine kinase
MGVNAKSAHNAAPARPMDARVASSPLTGLRFNIDTRIGDLDDYAHELELDLRDVKQQRADTLVHLRRNEEVRRQALDTVSRLKSIPPPVSSDVLRCFNDGFALTTELGRVEERIAGLQARLQDVASERVLLRHSSEQLWHASAKGDFEVDIKASRYSQAARQIYQIVDDEHAAMARAILDGPMQRLADAALEAELLGRALSGQLPAAKDAARRCRDATLEAATGLSRQINNLDPLDAHHGLVAALRELIGSYPAQQHVRLSVLGTAPQLEPLGELAVYRVVKESIDNAITHGRAQHVDVVLSFNNGRVTALVKDDGDGFDVSATEARMGRTRALGLIEMRERVRLVGGRLELRSILGMGTEVRATVSAH